MPASLSQSQVAAQRKPRPARQQPVKTPASQPTPTPEVQTPKPKTRLVMVPAIVTGADGRYVPDLKQGEFAVFEDDVKQDVALFSSVSEPVSVVLMLDTSTSTQEKLREIRKAAVSFVDQLQTADRVKVITFDEQVRELNDFTADRSVVKSAILKAVSGYSTKFYDAMNVALESVKEVEGRKAIVIFSDGVDYRSDYASAEGTLRLLEEEGVVVYPIRFDTRAAAERLAREQLGAPKAPVEIVKSTPGTTGSRSPDEIPSSVPGGERKTGPLGLPSPEEILRRRRESGRDRRPTGDLPSPGEVGSDIPTGRGDPRVSSRSREKAPEDTIGVMLDRLYSTADGYLKSLADKSAGQLLRADDITSLPAAFSKVAAELRTQYWLGYAPLNQPRADQYHVIKVTSSRPNVIIRARPGRRIIK